MIGTKLAHFEINLGSGGMGDVYQATDTKLAEVLPSSSFPKLSATISNVLHDFNVKPACSHR